MGNTPVSGEVHSKQELFNNSSSLLICNPMALPPDLRPVTWKNPEVRNINNNNNNNNNNNHNNHNKPGAPSTSSNSAISLNSNTNISSTNIPSTTNNSSPIPGGTGSASNSPTTPVTTVVKQLDPNNMKPGLVGKKRPREEFEEIDEKSENIKDTLTGAEKLALGLDDDSDEEGKTSEDGFRWRKYGRKSVKGSKYPRSYYKCTYSGCQVKKQVEVVIKNNTPTITTVYKGTHAHEKPQMTNLRATDQQTFKNSVLEGFAKQLSVLSTTPSLTPVSLPRLVVETSKAVNPLEDGYRWRKYGQKLVKGSKWPRSYYKCSEVDCTVKKQVDQLDDAIVNIYEGIHNHHPPSVESNKRRRRRSIIKNDSSSQLGDQPGKEGHKHQEELKVDRHNSIHNNSDEPLSPSWLNTNSNTNTNNNNMNNNMNKNNVKTEKPVEDRQLALVRTKEEQDDIREDVNLNNPLLPNASPVNISINLNLNPMDSAMVMGLPMENSLNLSYGYNVYMYPGEAGAKDPVAPYQPMLEWPEAQQWMKDSHPPVSAGWRDVSFGNSCKEEPEVRDDTWGLYH
eukprot:TRINITY_DN771_c0_g1_i3.p1 TRINITY_DN771_c0_g1~~TRINITY_DN771_c0_g1_i3.p1  ORF type:complete len:565 (+),score=150.18 TRINITY_DN771_c0_g1_i3:116-1810(+)